MSLKAKTASLFVRLNPPSIVVPKGGKQTAAKIAQDFAIFIDSATEEANATNGTQWTPAEGLWNLLSQGITFQQLIDENPEKVSTVQRAVGLTWGKQKGFRDGYRYLTPTWVKWFVYRMLPLTRPDLSKVLVEHPKGEEWMADFVKSFRAVLWGK